MPRKKPQSSQELVEQEGRIALAISALNRNEISSVRRAAAVYIVPPSTLRDRLQGREYRQELRANNHRLSIIQEKTLVEWILSLDRRGASPRPEYIAEMANFILKTDNRPGYTPVGKNWATNFTKRRPELKSRFARKYNYQRAKCEDPRVICTWIDTLQQARMQYGISDEDIFNFDETGFAMGITSASKVVTSSEISGKPQLLQPGNRDWVAAIECINASGWAVPSTIIFKGKRQIEGWYEAGFLPDDWRVEVSPNGWTSDEIGLR